MNTSFKELSIPHTSLQQSEALFLTGNDLDFENNLIHINKSIEHNGIKPYVTSPKTSAGTRDVVMLDVLKKVLPKNLKKSEILFGTNNGQYLHSSNINRLIKKYREESGVTITPHQLRHAYATLLYEADVPDKDAQILMGHTDITLTRNTYTHIRNASHKLTTDKLNKYINTNEN